MTASTIAVQGRRSWLDRLPVRVRVLSFAALLAAAGAGALVLTPGATTFPDRPWSIDPILLVIALIVGFGLAEATALHVEIRKESHSLSLSSVPLLIGVLMASPTIVALAYVAGSAPTMRWVRRSDWLKAIWNSCLFFCEAALAALIVRTALGDALPSGTAEWMVPLGAALVAELMSLLAVPLVIMVVDAHFRPSLFGDVGRSQILATLASTFTVVALAAALMHPGMLIVATIPIIGIGLLLQSTGHLSQRHRDLQQLHTFTTALANERSDRTVDAGLTELVDIMKTRGAGLFMSAHEEAEPRLRLLLDDAFDDAPSPLIARLLDRIGLDSTAITVLTPADRRPEVHVLLRELEAMKILVAPILAEADRHGVLFVTDRLGMRAEFTSDELRLFASLARTLSSRLSNDLLVARLETQARHDALTGLPNRLSFEIAVTAALAKGERRGAVVMIDLDRFKEINDSLGHETGDQLLIEVARRLRTAVRSCDLVARFGGDEFALMLTETDGVDELDRRITAIHAALTSKVALDGITFETGASFGVARWPDHGADSTELLRCADSAMYEAKRNQLGVVWYRPELDADAPRRLDLYLSVGEALDREQLFIQLQPKLALADGSITGAEALIRWIHPTHGVVPPAEFVPLIVQAGLTTKLTRFVVRRAAQAAASLQAAGYDIPVAVNLTPRDLLDLRLPDDIGAILGEVGVAPCLLQVEITEDSMVVDFETSASVLHRLRALGVCVAIDDFGTGYSSLQHLHHLPVDQLKIDRSFVGRATTESSAASIVRASVNLARELGLATIAEGVEDLDTVEFLSAIGCAEVQGYHISRPLDLDAFVDWVERHEDGPLVAPSPTLVSIRRSAS